MNKIMQSVAFAAACVAAATSSVAAAEVSTARLPSIGSSVTSSGSSFARQGASVKEESNLFGAPLFLIILGAVAVTIGTIVVVDNGSKSP